jgi:hypothetical protein
MQRISFLCKRKIGPQLWQLTENLTFFGSSYGWLTIPEGFYTDGASSPSLSWAICPPMSGLTAEPAVLHDWLYSLDCKLQITRKDADSIFLEAMRHAGVNKVKALAIYNIIRVAGWSSWRQIHSVAKKRDGAYKYKY